MLHEKIEIGSTANLYTYIIENSPEIDMERKRPAIIICPGGGYEMTSDREAEAIAIRMMNDGFQAFVLRYSVRPSVYPQALTELASVVKLVRNNASTWFVDPERIIVCGFSAGGHLAASLGVFWKKEFLQEKLQGSSEEWKPNGLLLSYPVISSGEFAHVGSFKALLADEYNEMKDEMSLENQVTKDTPPTFLWHTVEDNVVPVENSLFFAQSLRKANVPFELHIFPNGGHGLSLATEETISSWKSEIQNEVAIWPQLFSKWAKSNI